MTAAPADSRPQLYRVELHLLTYLWNEGFEKAEQPWLRLYTDNGDWARSLPKRFNIPEPDGLEQEFKVKVEKLAAGKMPPAQDELDGIVRERLAQWDGV